MADTTYSIPPLCKDAAQFLFSTLHLLLTRIIPLIAMLVGSLLLHLLHVTTSFLFTKPFDSRRKLSSVKQRRHMVLQGRDLVEVHDSFALYEDALQDGAVNSDEGAEYAMDEECYEDCQNDDDRWTMVGDRHAAAIMENGDENLYVSQELLGEENDLSKEVGDYHLNMGKSLQNVGANVMQKELGDSLRELAGGGTDHDLPQEIMAGRAADEKTGDSQRLLSQGSLFPSDLPRSLDNVIIAAAVNGEEGRTRPLVPTFSSVAAAVQETMAATHQPLVESVRAQQLQAPGDAAGPRRTSSYDKFAAKFKEHFMLDGR